MQNPAGLKHFQKLQAKYLQPFWVSDFLLLYAPLRYVGIRWTLKNVAASFAAYLDF